MKSTSKRVSSLDIFQNLIYRYCLCYCGWNYEEEGMFQGDITEILIPIITRIKAVNNQAIPETPVSFAAYLEEAYEENFPDSTLTPYVDAQTGIKSLNHYVLGVYDE